MINYIISLVSQYFSSGFSSYFFFPLIALAFLATVPIIIRDIFLRRSH